MKNAFETSRALSVSDRQGFNRRWYADQLESIYAPATSQEVVEDLTTALSSYPVPGQIRIVCGRHCYEDFVYERGKTKCIIDVSQINQVAQVMLPPDPGKTMLDARYELGAGTANWNAFQQMHDRFGKVLPSGSCYSVGSGGHVSVGGYGLLSRLFGLTCDLVVGFEIVTVNSDRQVELRYAHEDASDQNDRDLYWALRGAGVGNFGVITKYYFGETLPKAPLRADISTYAWDWADITTSAKLKAICDIVRDLFNGSNGLDFPLTEFGIFRLFHRAKGQLNMTVQNVYTDEAAFATERAHYLDRTADRLKAFASAGVPVVWAAPGPIDPDQYFDPKFVECGKVLASRDPQKAANDITRNYTMYEAVQTLNGSGPNKRGKYKSAYMLAGGFTGPQHEIIFRYLNESGDADFSDTRINIDSYGGRINAPDHPDTPIPQRTSIFKLQYQTYWQTSQTVGAPDTVDQPNIDWVRRLYTEMYASTGGVPSVPGTPSSPNNTDGCYYGYPDIDLGTDEAETQRSRRNAMELYFGPENYARLRKIKTRVDPLNIFQSKQSVEPE